MFGPEFAGSDQDLHETKLTMPFEKQNTLPRILSGIGVKAVAEQDSIPPGIMA
jgi:hypothetical protein